ncbi:MAG: methylated-DNA--[protein]-cysteine S-methyltransferase [Candidatus Krumholzibacteriaceae bacterium]|jgi:AraC family transcriptional regulator of adaptative response/methylated-DNA-[protein]-cysteine methyltransferase
MKPAPNRTEMDRAFRNRDASYDGLFYIGVRTTGIFCRPSCPARRPLPRNAEFFQSAREALFAGYRPCKRCEPLKAAGDLPPWISALLDRVENDTSARIKDAELRSSGLEPAKVRRFFLSRFGMTFQAYCRARRLGRAFDEIKSGSRLDDVILSHGYESHSGFRDAFFNRFGKPPGKAKGEDYIRISWVDTPLGPMAAGATAKGVCLLEFTDRRMLEAQFEALSRRFGMSIAPGENELVAKLRSELDLYFSGRLKRFTVPIEYPGSDFQVRVWRALLGIRYGETRSYEDVARALGAPGAMRAVGHANGLNRIAIVIPCHRVVNKSGELGGYGGGLWRKRRLLALEQGEAFR